MISPPSMSDLPQVDNGRIKEDFELSRFNVVCYSPEELYMVTKTLLDSGVVPSSGSFSYTNRIMHMDTDSYLCICQSSMEYCDDDVTRTRRPMTYYSNKSKEEGDPMTPGARVLTFQEFFDEYAFTPSEISDNEFSDGDFSALF